MKDKKPEYTLETPLCGTFTIKFKGIRQSILFCFSFMPIGGYAAHAYTALTGQMPRGDVEECFKIVKIDLKKRILAFEINNGQTVMWQ